MVCVNCIFISHSSTRGHVQSRAPGIEDKGHHFFCAVVGARPDLRTALGHPRALGCTRRCASGGRRVHRADPMCRPPVAAWVPTAAELDAPLHRPPPRDGSTALEPSRAAETRRTRQDTRGRGLYSLRSSYTVDGRVCACAGRVCPRVSVECVLSVRAREDGGGKGGGREAVAEGLKGRGEAEGRRRFVRPVSVPQASTFYGRRRTGRTRSPWSPA